MASYSSNQTTNPTVNTSDKGKGKARAVTPIETDDEEMTEQDESSTPNPQGSRLTFSRLINGFERTLRGIKNAFVDDKPRLESLVSVVKDSTEKARNAQLDPSSQDKPKILKRELEERIHVAHTRHNAAAIIIHHAEDAHRKHFGQHFGDGTGQEGPYNADEAIDREVTRIVAQHRPVPSVEVAPPSTRTRTTTGERRKRKPAAAPAAPRMRTRAASRRAATAASAAPPSPPPPPVAVVVDTASAHRAPSPTTQPTPERDDLSLLTSAAVAVEASAPACNKRKRGGDEGGASSPAKRARTAAPAAGVSAFADIPSVGRLVHMSTAEVFMAGVEYAIGNGVGASTEVNDRMRAFVREKFGETL